MGTILNSLEAEAWRRVECVSPRVAEFVAGPGDFAGRAVITRQAGYQHTVPVKIGPTVWRPANLRIGA